MWRGYMEVEPFGGRQDDLRAGRVAEAVYASFGAKVPPSDLFESLGATARPRRRQGKDEVTKTLRAIARLTGAA